MNVDWPVVLTVGAVVPLLALLALLLWGIKQPLAWVIVSVLAIAIGGGCLAYGISEALLLEEMGAGKISDSKISEVSRFFGGGAGATLGGTVLLVVALLRLRKPQLPSPNQSLNPTGNRPAN